MGYPYNPKMIISAIVLHLLLLSHQTVSEEQVQRYVTGEKDENTTLQCLDQPVNASSLLYRWKKNGAVVATQNPSKPSEHLSISNNGSLWISGLQYIDEGQYECESQTKDGSSWQTLSNILLRIAGMVLWISKSNVSHLPGKYEAEMPYPLGDPMVTALVGSNITLSCTETDSLPPAKTVWMRKDNKIINTTSKYIVSDNNPNYKLTIINVTKEDEGIYYCYSINPLGPKELEVYLTVKTSANNKGAVVGVFVSVLIMMIGITVGVTIYSKRDRICIGLGFSHLDDDRGDILSLVDSDEEVIFHDTVPQLPPLTNGHATTLVEIHRIPSSDHEDNADSTVQHNDQTHP
ncbi:V-set and immunoglobulin domain-containing protein 10-like [Sinocyclocheilus rhinocerous]|uniref:V-set and immunoglobulin domain-containing protein 10-like n=1 Tax=Sinocyclocheilus rhinocerous TaxID=307959 RepID=UPI0007B8D75A|nr:PREDICTED: V-set and immunoglobulin domain-containing protein 10-like [Sinocyclocheilus rhinocerous]